MKTKILLIVVLLAFGVNAIPSYSPYKIYQQIDTLTHTNLDSNLLRGSDWSVKLVDTLEKKFIRFNDVKDSTFQKINADTIAGNTRFTGSPVVDGSVTATGGFISNDGTFANIVDSLSRKAPRCSIAVNSYVKSLHKTSGKQGAGLISDNGSVITIGSNTAIGLNYLNYNAKSLKGLQFKPNSVATFTSTPEIRGDSKVNLIAIDDSPLSAGNGGGIGFWGIHTDPNKSSLYAAIRGYKANATDGNYAGQMHFQTRIHNGHPVTRMIIDERGKVGINTTTPDSQLTVTGGGHFTGGLKVDGKLTATADSALAALRLDGKTKAYYDTVGRGYNLARANHTGAQAISTVTGLQTALDGKEPAFSKNAGFNPTQNVNSTASPTFAGVTIAANGLNLGGTEEPNLAQSNNSKITWGVYSVAANHYTIMTQFKPYTNTLGILNWSSRLQLNWYSGIEIGAGKDFGGTRFFNSSPAEGGTQIMSIGDGDDNVRIENDLYVKHDKLVWHAGNLTPAAIGAAPLDTGSFPCTLKTSDVTVQQIGTAYYTKIGNTVTISFPYFGGTSNSAFFRLYCKVPYLPKNPCSHTTGGTNNAAIAIGTLEIETIEKVYHLFSLYTGAFTASGTKSIFGTTVAYIIAD